MMSRKEVLIVDCCIRGKESRTAKLMNAFADALPESCSVTVLNLMEEGLQYFSGDYFRQRERLLGEGALDHPRFRYAHQFAGADIVAVAAPFWDLSFPALLKVYIEQITIDGITIRPEDNALKGACKGTDLIFLTTRGGVYAPGTGLEAMDIGTAYMKALKDFYGFDRFHLVAAEGLDIFGNDADAILKDALKRAEDLAKSLF